jgi:hypothetical protein
MEVVTLSTLLELECLSSNTGSCSLDDLECLSSNTGSCSLDDGSREVDLIFFPHEVDH